jgi:hypothetical protein
MEFASEMIVKSALRGLKISEVPTTLSTAGRCRPPHLRTWRDGWRHLRFLLLHSPRWLFLYPGLFFVAIGLVAIGALWSGLVWSGPVQLTPRVSIDIHSLVAACFAIIIGSQLVMFSALAQKYAIVEGFMPSAATFKRTLSSLTLERILQCGFLLLLIGLIGSLWAVYSWVAMGFGPIL